MVRLVTQYNGRIFNDGKGWDGADGPWVFHGVRTDLIDFAKTEFSGSETDIEEWMEGDHLNSFRLELIYD